MPKNSIEETEETLKLPIYSPRSLEFNQFNQIISKLLELCKNSGSSDSRFLICYRVFEMCEKNPCFLENHIKFANVVSSRLLFFKTYESKYGLRLYRRFNNLVIDD